MNKKDNNRIILGILGFLIIALAVMGQYFTTKEVNDVVLSSISYEENADTNYRVYYHENPFYTDEYIEENHFYVAKYIDHINADFKYDVNYTDKLSGSYSYKVVALLTVYQTGNESVELWTKEYILSDNEIVDYKDYDDYKIVKNIDIDYQTYLNDYLAYKDNSDIPTSAKLDVKFIVNNEGEYPGLDKVDFKSYMMLTIPLGEEAFKIQIDDNIKREEMTIKKVESNEIERLFTSIAAVLSWGLTLGLFVMAIIIYHKTLDCNDLYKKKLKKILTTYDNIIVDVEKMPSMLGLKVMEVTTFEELLDAQKELKVPINFMEEKKKGIAKFVLIRNDLAWIYTLKKANFEK